VSRRLTAAGAVVLAAVLALPATASAHGLVGKQDLPIPRWLFAWGAALVLVISFVGLATLWPKPRLEDVREKRVFRLLVQLEVLGGLIGIAVFVIVVYAGFAGVQTPTANLTPTVVYVLFWVGLPVLSCIFGDVFRPFNPWLAIGRGTGWLVKRLGAGAEPIAYPTWLGRWPAALGILGFAWVELVLPSDIRADPSTLSILILAYAAAQIVGMSVYGTDAWGRYGDAFGVYFNLFSRLAPLHWERGELRRRVPLAGAPRLDPVPGTVALLCTMIGTTSFDGFSQGPIWTATNGLGLQLQRRFLDLGLNAEHAQEAAFTIGLLGVVLIVSGIYRLGVIGMQSVGEDHTATELGRRFVHSLIPIALAYVVAHYCSLLLYQGQAIAYLISDPLGHGSNIFGTADKTIDYSVITATGVWYVQVVALVLGHACGLALAHDRALFMYRSPRAATRSQYWMLVVMIGFTSLGLWLLSAANS
jgi:hypothetical protein